MPVRIERYEQAFELIKIPLSAQAKAVLRKLEKEGHMEKSICFAIWKEQKLLMEKSGHTKYWGIFINTIRKWSWGKDDPRWEGHNKKKAAQAKAQKTQERIEDIKEHAFHTKYSGPMPGFIYFVQGECGGPIKIGYTNDIEKRLRALQTGYPDILKLLLAFPGNPQYEKLVHKQLDKYRLQGEWFKPSPEVMNRIRDFKIMNNRVIVKQQKEKINQRDYLES